MKFYQKLLLALILNAALTYGLLYFFVLSKNIVIPADSVIEKNLSLTEGSLTIESGSKVKGNLILHSGTITIKENAEVGGVFLDTGTLTIGKNVHVRGNVEVENGEISLAENVIIDGNVVLPVGTLKKDSSAKIQGSKPDVFITSNWPEPLAFFDVLPEEHKKSVGYIFLTKDSNTVIRDPSIKTAEDYFEGIYVYQNHDVHPVDLSRPEVAQKFFDRAKTFFGGLPERRLGPFGVGATTQKYAFDKKKADIYIPSVGSKYTFIHEMGHVMDFKDNFIDFHKPVYPFLSREVAMNDYGGTHPGEDFAEAYRHYVLFRSDFLHLIKERSERQQKYDFMKKYVFQGKEFVMPGVVS